MVDILPSDLNVVADSNTTVPDGSGSTVDTSENCAPSGINNAIRSLAAAIAAAWGGMYSGTSRPTAVRDNSLWRNTSSGIKFYNGTSDVDPPLAGATDTNGNEALVLTATASAVNHVNLTNNVTTSAPKIEAAGDDTNIDLDIDGKGTGLPNFPAGFKSSGATAFAFGTQQILTSGTTYTPPSGCRAINVVCVGGGGGGGGTGASGSSTTAIGGAGGGGAKVEKFITDLESSYTYAIGAGGTGGVVVGSGSAGGDTTFSGGSVALSAGGGGAGNSGTATSGTLLGASTAGGSASGGDVNINGSASGNIATVSGDAISVPLSGASPLGGGSVAPASLAADGTDATAPGAGGSGGVAQDTATGRTGGDGAAGLIIIREFY